MAAWMITIAAVLASLMLAGPAFAQATTGSPASGAETKGKMVGDEKVRAAQQALKDKGHDPGAIDGQMGPKTQAALRDFQKALGMTASGRLDDKTMQALGVEAKPSGAAGAASPPTPTDTAKDAAGAKKANTEKKIPEKKY